MALGSMTKQWLLSSSDKLINFVSKTIGQETLLNDFCRFAILNNFIFTLTLNKYFKQTCLVLTA